MARGRRPDRFESEQADFFERVREGYLHRAQRIRIAFALSMRAGAVADVGKELEAILSGVQFR